MVKRSTPEPDDRALVLSARTSPDTFDLLYRRHVAQVYRYCYVRAGNQSDAEDLTAQVFLAVLEGLHTYRGQGSFAAWLFGIARRKCADYHRRRHAGRSLSLEGVDRLADPAAADPVQHAHRSSLMRCVQSALPHLTADRREALCLRFWGGLTVRQVAAAMRRSEGAVKMLVSRAIADLRGRCLDEMGE